jgi:hypothetical protein
MCLSALVLSSHVISARPSPSYHGLVSNPFSALAAVLFTFDCMCVGVFVPRTINSQSQSQLGVKCVLLVSRVPLFFSLLFSFHLRRLFRSCSNVCTLVFSTGIGCSLASLLGVVGLGDFGILGWKGRVGEWCLVTSRWVSWVEGRGGLAGWLVGWLTWITASSVGPYCGVVRCLYGPLADSLCHRFADQESTTRLLSAWFCFGMQPRIAYRVRIRYGESRRHAICNGHS